MSYDEFKKRIDTARQILVGAVPSPAGQIDQITYALIYKFMNDIDDKSAALPSGKRGYFVGDYEKYNWHRLMDSSLGAHERLDLYRNAIQTMAKNENIPELFRSIYQNAFLPFNSPTVLNLFLKEIDKFSHGESDDIGDAYEYLLSITGAQGDVGQFRTPRHIIKFIVEAVNPTKDDKVLDPAVGTAGFLIAAYNHVLAQHDGKDESGGRNDEKRLTADELEKIHHNYRGFDIDPTMVRTAKVNLYLHGFKTPDIINHDSLSSEDYWNDWYDVILANPPFMTPKGGIQPHKKFGITANRAEVLFVDYIASHLKPNGRAGIVVPEGIIFQSGKAYKELRKNLVENSLYAVISLPAGVFNPYAGVKTSVLLLDKELAKQNDEILFVKVENDGYSLNSQRRPISGNQLPEALQVIEQFKSGEESKTELAHTVSRKEIAESSDYNLSGDRYKTGVTSYVHELSATTQEILKQVTAAQEHVFAQIPDLSREITRVNGLIASSAFKTLQESTQSAAKALAESLTAIKAVNVPKIELPKISESIIKSIDQLHKMKEFQSGYPVVYFNDTDIFQIESGGTPNSKIQEYWDGDVAWATLADLPGEDFITTLGKTKRTISEEGLKKSSAKILPPQSILISSRATIGRIAINEIPLATNQGFKNIVIKDTGRVNPKFAAYMTTWLRGRLNDVATGGTFAEFSKKDLLDFGIPLPPIEIQREIVAELDSYQKIIDAAQTIVKTYKPTIKVEPDWEIVKVGDIFKTGRGRVISKTDMSENPGEYPVYSSQTSNNGEFGRIGTYDFEGEYITWTTDGANAGAVFYRNGKFNCTNVCGTAKPLQEFIGKVDLYYAAQIISGLTAPYVVRVGNPKLMNKEFERIAFPLPSIEIQREIVAELEAEQKLIDANKKLIEIYQQKIKSKIAEVWGE